MPEKKDEKPNESSVGSTIQKKFLKERKIFLWGEVSDESAKEITETLLYLEADAPGKPITFYINTPGGSITAGMAIYDTIKMISSEVSVIVTGMAASMGSILLSAPKKGNRYLYPHSYVMIHQPLIAGQLRGPAVDIHIHAQYLEQLRKRLNEILSDASGQPLSKIEEDTDRDFYMTAKEAIAYGLADKIIDEVQARSESDPFRSPQRELALAFPKGILAKYQLSDFQSSEYGYDTAKQASSGIQQCQAPLA